MNELWGEFMKKHELLVPAGDMECLKQAVYHGADAVYLACKNFGARKFASNFTNEEIVEAIRFCHLYGVKIYVTMNTLVKDSEVNSFLAQALFLHKHGVDALIVQDFGMICYLREKYPNLEIHASTQANNSSVETCEMFYKLGVKRVVFSRELSIDEIDQIEIPIEKEAFIHGALCVSYSGCCLMSSMIGGRSGNRGECAGSCRLPYSLLKDHKLIRDSQYLLSMKELNTSPNMKRLLNSSVYSFKIEGRMKGPLYVGFITSFYRKLIDQEPFSLEETTDQLKTIFNREFTMGHLFGVSGMNLINAHSPNHIGLKIGNASIHQDKIRLVLDKGKTLHQHDSIRFLKQNKGMVVNYLYDENMCFCNSSSSICYVDNKVGFNGSDLLMKTQDKILEEEMILSDVEKKIPLSLSVVARMGKPLLVSVSDGINTIEKEFGMVEEALSSPMSEEAILEKLSKLGNTPFCIRSTHVDMDSNIFIPVKVLNEIRRSCVDELMEKRRNPDVSVIEKKVSFSYKATEPEIGFSCFVRNEEQLLACLEYPFIRIYVSSKSLFEKYKQNPSIVYYPGRCHSSYTNRFVERNVVADTFYYSNSCFGNYFLNVTNIYTAYYLKKLGLKNIPLSCELSLKEVYSLIEHFRKKFGEGNFEYPIYGKIENMIIKDNVLDIEKNSFSYHLMDMNQRLYPVYYDGEKTHIYHFENRDMCHESLPFCGLLLFYDESKEEIQSIIKKLGKNKKLC